MGNWWDVENTQQDEIEIDKQLEGGEKKKKKKKKKEKEKEKNMNTL